MHCHALRRAFRTRLPARIRQRESAFEPIHDLTHCADFFFASRGKVRGEGPNEPGSALGIGVIEKPQQARHAGTEESTALFDPAEPRERGGRSF